MNNFKFNKTILIEVISALKRNICINMLCVGTHECGRMYFPSMPVS